MKQKLLNRFWLRVGMIVAVMTTALTGTAWAETESVVFSEEGYDNAQAVEVYNGSAFTVTFNKGTNNNNAPKYYSTGAAIRCYGGNSFTISSDYTITAIELAFASGDGSNAITADKGTFEANTWTGSENEVTFTIGGTSGHRRIASITVTYATGGGDTKLEDCDLALTNAPVALDFDLYNNHQAQVIQYTTSSTGEVWVEAGAYDVSCSVDEDAKTITVTPIAVTNSSQTVTVNQKADNAYKAGSVTFTVTVTDSTPIATHVATFSVNGTTTTQEFVEGVNIDFPANPADVSGKTFVGWTTAAISGTTDEAPTLVKSATMGDRDITFYAVFAYANGSGAGEVTDVLNQELTGVTGTSYSEWSCVNATSSAVYAGQSAGGNDAIQLRSNNNNSGIVTTTSGGKATKVAITWNSKTSDGRTINVYGSNSAYSAATNLYSSSTQGTLIGTIVCGTSTELTISDDYEYVGLRSASGAMYLDKIEITWSTGGGVSYSDYCTTVVAAAVERPVITVAENPFTFSTTATVTCETAGAVVMYSYDGENWIVYTDALTITETTTIYAKAVKDSDESSVASVTATKVLAEPAIAIDATGITNTDLYVGTDAGNLSATITYNDAAIEGATVTWSSDNDKVATIDATTGAVTLVATGTVTFTATYAGNADYSEKAATYEMTVTNSDPNAPGSENNPYTVAQARAAIDAGTGVTGVYAKGIVSKIVTAYSSQFGNISYNISADGTEEADQLQAYRGKSYKGENFTSADDIQVGDTVVIYGNLKKYNTTYEFDADNQLVSLSRTEVVEPIIELRMTSVEVSAEGVDGVIGVIYRNFTDYTADVEFYEADGKTTATYDWIIAKINEDGYINYIVDANTDAEGRTAYMKVHAINEDGADIYSGLVTINQAGVVVDYATVPFAYNGGKSNLPTGFTQNGLGNDYSSATTKFKFDSTGDELVVKIDKAAAMLFFDIKGNSFSGGTFTVQTSADGTAYAELSSYTNLDDTQTEALQLDANVRYIKWVYTEKSSGNVGLGNIKVVDWIDQVTVGEAGYATYVAKHNESFPVGVEAYKAAVNGQYVTLTAVTAVPKGTPVVLKGEGTFTLIPTIANNLSDVTGNELKASDGTVEGNGSIYVLAQPADEKVGFYAVKKGTKVAEGKAYLEVVSTTGVKAFYFEGDDATSLNEELRMKNEESKGEEIYNLAGQRISKMQKGINIVGGKKILR